jgi:hypothetical protein
MWRLSMSGANATTKVRLEDHLGPLVPGVTSPLDRETPTTLFTGEHRSRLNELAEQMRRSVVDAVEATDLAVKTTLWDAYRSARSEALAIVSSASEHPDSRHLWRL